VDPDPHGPESRLDPDPHWVTDLYSIPGGQKWPAKKGNKCIVLDGIFKAGGFSCCLDVLHGIKKCDFSSVAKFLIFKSSNPWIWIRLRIEPNADTQICIKLFLGYFVHTVVCFPFSRFQLCVTTFSYCCSVSWTATRRS
jgi:hypothetical protein